MASAAGSVYGLEMVSDAKGESKAAEGAAYSSAKAASASVAYGFYAASSDAVVRDILGSSPSSSGVVSAYDAKIGDEAEAAAAPDMDKSVKGIEMAADAGASSSGGEEKQDNAARAQSFTARFQDALDMPLGTPEQVRVNPSWRSLQHVPSHRGVFASNVRNPPLTALQEAERAERVRAVVGDFVRAASRIGKVIIDEQHLPEAKKTVKPSAKFGGLHPFFLRSIRCSLLARAAVR